MAGPAPSPDPAPAAVPAVGRDVAGYVSNMPRLPVKAAPLALLAQAAMVARDHWNDLSPKDRAELTRLLRATGGRPGNLTTGEKADLKRLVGRLDLPGLGRNLAPLAQKHGRRRR